MVDSVPRFGLARLVIAILSSFLIAQPSFAEVPAKGPDGDVEVSRTSPVGDPLPSWTDTESRKEIIAFVEASRDENSAGYIEPRHRIAVFDNDGTLWAEQPVYVQLAFAIDRVKALSSAHPEWKDTEPFASILRDDWKALAAGGERAILDVVMATHAGMTTEAFAQTVKDWIATARHPKTGRLYTQMVYQPMLELMDYLRSNGFKTFIVSGGGIEFMRPWAEAVYGVPPEQVIGSSIVTTFEIQSGVPVLVRQPKLNFVDDKEGKPVAINQHIGRRPVAAFGNSDGDLQMLQWTCLDREPSFCLIVHHTDQEREWAYDRQSHVGQLAKALDQAAAAGWTVVDMKRDWGQVFPDPTSP
jgi:phosphoserine phosphatase